MPPVRSKDDHGERVLIPLLIVTLWLALSALVIACCVAAARGDTTALLVTGVRAGPERSVGRDPHLAP